MYHQNVGGSEMARFMVGSRVQKTNGYPFDGTVVSVFPKLNGEIRLVVESDVIPGMLHIFSQNQMEIMPNRVGVTSWRDR